jgi:hypothetical protein
MIAVCIPLFDPHPNFLVDFAEFYAFNKKRHDLRIAPGSLSGRKPLHNVQTAAMNFAVDNSASHVLFFEDDHWRFPTGGLDVLLEEDLPAIGFATIQRSYPYTSLALKRIDSRLPIDQTSERNMVPVERAGKDQPIVMQADVVSWAMHLVKTEVFKALELNPFRMWGEVPTDSLFAVECEKAEIPRHVHFGCVLPHGDVEPEHRLQLRKLHNFKRAVRMNPAAAEEASRRFEHFVPADEEADHGELVKA